MSHQLGRLVSVILERYFGDIVQKVGYDLFINGSKPIAMIMKTTGLPRIQVIESLRTLLKFDFVTFEPSVIEGAADYKLNPDNVLLLIRYPRYLLQIKSKYGTEAELIVEELLQMATATASVLLVTIANKYKDDTEKNINIVKLRDTFCSLGTAGYIQQAPVAEAKEGSDIPTMVPVATVVSDIDIRPLLQAMDSGDMSHITDNVYWKVNFDRFHQDFRDEIMISAITRQIDENAGELMKYMLEQMYLTSPAWAPESNPMSLLDLKECCRRSALEKPLLIQHFDQYFKVIEESSGGFVRRVQESGGGQCAVGGARAARALAAALLDRVVADRLGDKAARIFRLIRARKYVEEEDIQKHAMLPNKECKELTYKLMAEHFVSIQPMRKAASAGAMAKAIYLYHVKFHECACAALQMSWLSLHNVAARAAHERAEHARLRDKRRRVRSIVHGMRLRREPEQNIADVEETITPPELATLARVDARLRRLSAAELQLDRSLFLLHWYFMYPQH